jgi:hypothetical protein
VIFGARELSIVILVIMVGLVVVNLVKWVISEVPIK